MHTKNLPIPITFDSETTSILTIIAKKQHISLARLAKKLILEALEERENITLSTIAKTRDTEKMKWVSHKKAWK